MTNRLQAETSPYLRQHAGNPVAWQPWDPTALDEARRRDCPIFLSIGYSACHWCHVMEHESFEDAAIAQLLNERFVCIKVDREERPDLDQIYMSAVLAMTGRGGWPMSVFLTPQLKPFFGGTYWPPRARQGMPGFEQIVTAVSDAWSQRRAACTEQAEELTRHIRESAEAGTPAASLPDDLIAGAVRALERAYDARHGGFGRAPKFPHPLDIRLLLHDGQRRGDEGTRTMALRTLDRMAAGGIYDQLGGGFHRYSVDERWLVPHFEKMLYDNALLTVAYVEAWQQTENPAWRQVVVETCDYVLREMRAPDGGFASTQDADSEGVEGEFYVWTPRQIEAVLGPDRARAFNLCYDVTPGGNFEHRTILNRSQRSLAECATLLGVDPAALAEQLALDRQALLAARGERVWPGRDDKVLVGWNGLEIDALALAGGVLDEPRYLDAARESAAFLLNQLRGADGRLLHSWCQGAARYAGYLDDYAALANGLVSLYEATFEPRWLVAALELVEPLRSHFEDREQGGFFYTADDHEALIARQKDVQDSSIPSGNALAANVLTRLAKLTGRDDLANSARRTLLAAAEFMQRAPTAAGQMLLASELFQGPTLELVLSLPDDDARSRRVATAVRRAFLPCRVLAGGVLPRDEVPGCESLFLGRAPIGGEPTLFVCEGHACQAPIVGEGAIAAWLANAARSGAVG